MFVVLKWEGDVSGKGANPVGTPPPASQYTLGTGVTWVSWNRQRVTLEVTSTLEFLGFLVVQSLVGTVTFQGYPSSVQTAVQARLPGPALLPGHLSWIYPYVAGTRTLQSLTSVPKPLGTQKTLAKHLLEHMCMQLLIWQERSPVNIPNRGLDK